MATRRSLEERIQIVLLYGKFEKFSEIRPQWHDNFTSEAASVETISAIIKRFKETVSVADLPRPGRPTAETTGAKINEVKEVVEDSPHKSVRRGSSETGLSKSSYHRALQKHDMQPFFGLMRPNLNSAARLTSIIIAIVGRKTCMNKSRSSTLLRA